MASKFHFHDPREDFALRSKCTPSRPLPFIVRAFWPVVYALILILLILGVLADIAHAGGPHYVAGGSYFDAGTKGTPLTWSQGAVSYYTDQNDLSIMLPHAAADAFVADAFGRWTGISTAAVSATLAGQLAEDVNGTNVFVNADGSITMPADILPAAISRPMAFVYDNGGAVTDALLGQGASDPLYCFTNAVFGGPDNLATNAHIVHALIIINGNCAQTSAQLPDVKYQLVRAIGRALGLGWSQANLNVITRNPAPKPEDYAGFTIMHAQDMSSCVPIAACFSNPDQPKMDDRAALSRLYPVTTQNISAFPGKQLFFENTIRIHGTVRFVDAAGSAAQPMQGVNVVARWIDPASGKPSATSVAASVSGFLFRGKAGNPVNGVVDGWGQAFDRFGSDDVLLEGFFDLAGLEIPNGASSAQYQLTTEALDPMWSQMVEPYGPWQVQPSGAVQPITVTVSKGGDIQQDILMLGSALQRSESFGAEDYATPAPVPIAGDWIGNLSGYGDADYFWLPGQANRTLAVEVTALNANGEASEDKAQPVIGMWALADPPGTLPPAKTPSAFNSSTFAMTWLDATLYGSSGFRIGIADYRGDGRPDFRYHARVLYGDKVSPDRATVGGGTALAITGLGFKPGMVVTIGGVNAPVLSRSSNQLVVTAPALADGLRDVVIKDSVTGSLSMMSGAITYGAGSDDVIRVLSAGNPPTPIGTEAANAIRFGVYRSDGTSPVAGASVLLTATPAVAFAACGGASSCTLLSDDSGQVSTRVTPSIAGTCTITASLAPATYNPPKTALATLVATSSALDLGAVSPSPFIAEGATLDVPLSTRVLSNGVPLSGRAVHFQIQSGNGTLSQATVSSDAKGYANTSIHLATIAADVQISACVQPGDKPCQTFYLTAVPLSLLTLESMTGGAQMVGAGQPFQPVNFRVVSAGFPVWGASVNFATVIVRPQKEEPVVWLGDGTLAHTPAPVILASTQNTVLSDGNGVASLTPSMAGFAGPLIFQGTAFVGASSSTFLLESLAGMPGGFVMNRRSQER